MFTFLYLILHREIILLFLNLLYCFLTQKDIIFVFRAIYSYLAKRFAPRRLCDKGFQKKDKRKNKTACQKKGLETFYNENLIWRMYGM